MHCLLGISGVVIIFLIWVSIEAITETENWKFFDLDFENREGVISSYGSLLAGLLSLVSILFVLLDLTYQRRLKSQEDEQRESARNQRLKYNLEIITLFMTV